MEADSALNARAKPFIPGKSPAFNTPLLPVPSTWLGKVAKKNHISLATIPEQETASITPLIAPIQSPKDKSNGPTTKIETEINISDQTKEPQKSFCPQQRVSQTNTWNDHCLYLGMCGVDPQSMVPKGLMTKIEESKKVVSGGDKEPAVFTQLMSQLPSLGFGTCNLPDALAEMYNLVTPMNEMTWNWNMNGNVNVNTNATVNVNNNVNGNANVNANINTNVNANANVNVKGTVNGNTSIINGNVNININVNNKNNKLANKRTSPSMKDPIREMSMNLDHLTWDNLEYCVMQCSVAPIYHPETLYRAAQRAHRSVVRKKHNLPLYCEFLVQLSNNWPSFSFGPNDKGFEPLCNQIMDDTKRKYGRTDLTSANLGLTLSQLSLDSIGSETQNRNGIVIEKKNVSLVTLCVQVSLGFILYSNSSTKGFTQWLKDMVTNIGFVLELYLHQCLDFDPLRLIMVALMDKNEEWSWTALCETLTRYGHRLESTQATFIQECFDRIQPKSQGEGNPSDSELRIQTVLTQLIELRDNAWQKKKRTQTPKILLKEQHMKNPNNNNNNDINKSYASLVKTNLSNNGKKRLHVIPNDEKKAQNVTKRAVKTKETEADCSDNNGSESLPLSSMDTTVAMDEN